MQTITFRMDRQWKVLPYDTGNWVQSLGLEHDGGWYEKKNVYIYMYIYIHIYIGHFAVQQKLAQNCKPTIIKKCKKKLLSAHYVQCTGLAIGDTGVNPLKHFY